MWFTKTKKYGNIPLTPTMPVLAVNKRGKFDYEILETFEAGLKLVGHEVKSTKEGKINLKGSYVTITQNEAFLLNAHIAKYKKAGSLPDYDPYRTRKLLLNKKEINHLIGKQQEKGLTLVPLKVYTKNNRIKLEFGIGRGKKKGDKRRDIKKRDIDRDMKRKYGV